MHEVAAAHAELARQLLRLTELPAALHPIGGRYAHPDAHRILRISNIGTTDISSFVCFFSCSVGGYFAIRPARSDRSMAERVRMAKIADELRLSATRADGLYPSLTAPILNDQ